MGQAPDEPMTYEDNSTTTTHTRHDQSPVPDNASSGEIRRDIGRTRNDMSATLDELGQRLHPRTLLDDAIGLVRGTDKSGMARGAADTTLQAAGKTGELVSDVVTRHPVPAALITAGLAYLIYETHAARVTRSDVINPEPRMYGGSYVDARTGEPYDLEHYGRESGRAPSIMERLGEGISDTAQAVRHQASDLISSGVDQAKSAASHAAGSVADAGRSAASSAAGSARSAGRRVSGQARSSYAYARDQGRHAGHSAGQEARSVGQQAQAGIGRAASGAADAMMRNPLATGIFAVAAGALLGSLIPTTRTENEYLGEYGDEARDQAKAYGQEAYDRGRAVVNEATETARHEAEERGLTADNLRDAARNTAESARAEALRQKDEVADEAERAGKADNSDTSGDAETADREFASMQTPDPTSDGPRIDPMRP
ncbi:MAG: DUF3618 domain-containing protein [Phycisphaerae bacterium]